MPEVTLRFYEELNHFLKKERRKKDFQVDFQGKRSIKDMIESLGVPHTEVDLILKNGEPEERIIKTGLTTLSQVEVTEGLSLDEEIVLVKNK